MSMSKMKRAYTAHEYTGPRVSPKRSKAGLKQHYGMNADKRCIAWPQSIGHGKENKPVKSYQAVHCNQISDCGQTAHIKKVEQINLVSTQPLKPPQVNINWPLLDPAVEAHELTLSTDHGRQFGELAGYRIVDIRHVLEWTLSLQADHSRVCTCSQIEFVSENMEGMSSIFTFKCTTCAQQVWYKSSDPNGQLNKCFVWATLTSASHYSQSTQLLATMDVPTMSARLFRNGIILASRRTLFHLIQGQLHIARKELCYLVLFVDPTTPINVIMIKRDDTFIANMITKLVTFFKECILPEIILKRVPANYKCRDPPS